MEGEAMDITTFVLGTLKPVDHLRVPCRHKLADLHDLPERIKALTCRGYSLIRATETVWMALAAVSEQPSYSMAAPRNGAEDAAAREIVRSSGAIDLSVSDLELLERALGSIPHSLYLTDADEKYSAYNRLMGYIPRQPPFGNETRTLRELMERLVTPKAH